MKQVSAQRGERALEIKARNIQKLTSSADGTTQPSSLSIIISFLFHSSPVAHLQHLPPTFLSFYFTRTHAPLRQKKERKRTIMVLPYRNKTVQIYSAHDLYWWRRRAGHKRSVTAVSEIVAERTGTILCFHTNCPYWSPHSSAAGRQSDVGTTRTITHAWCLWEGG